MRYVQPEEADQVRSEQERGIQGPAGGGTRGLCAGSQAAGSYRRLLAAEVQQGVYPYEENFSGAESFSLDRSFILYSYTQKNTHCI